MNTKRVEIEDLQGAALAYAVGKAEGSKLWIAENNRPEHMLRDKVSRECYYPVGNWSQCGPLIERYIGGTDYQPGCVDGEFYAETRCDNPDAYANGETPLIAACRAIVAAHHPDGYVEVPVELLP